MTKHKQDLPPSRSEIEALEHGIYEWGDITSVSRLKGQDPSYLNQQLNPENIEHKGYYFPFILHLWYCDHSTDGVGDRYMELTAKLRHGWRGTKEPETAQVVELVRAVNGNMIELLAEQVNTMPYVNRMQFIDKAMMLLDDFKRDLQLNGIEDSPKSKRA